MAENGTIAYISTPKYCDFCRMATGEAVLAKYDFKTTNGQWGNGCPMHWRQYRLYDSLGVGKGQQLVIRESKMTVPPQEHDSSDLI